METLSDGDQFLQASGTVTIGTGGLDAGSRTITLAAGTFRLGGADRIADGSRLAMTGSAKLQLNGFDEILGGLSSPTYSTAAAIVNGAATVSTLTLDLTSSFGAQYFYGVLGGPGENDNNFGVVKTGNDQLVLATANTYDGPTVIDEGSINLGLAGTLGSTVGDTTVHTGGRLYVAATIPVEEDVSLGESSIFGWRAARQVPSFGATLGSRPIRRLAFSATRRLFCGQRADWRRRAWPRSHRLYLRFVRPHPGSRGNQHVHGRHHGA